MEYQCDSLGPCEPSTPDDMPVEKSDEDDSTQKQEPVEEYILMGLVFRVLSTDGAGIDAATNAIIESVSLMRGKNQTVQTRVEFIQEKDGKTRFASDM